MTSSSNGWPAAPAHKAPSGIAAVAATHPNRKPRRSILVPSCITTKVRFQNTLFANVWLRGNAGLHRCPGDCVRIARQVGMVERIKNLAVTHIAGILVQNHLLTPIEKSRSIGD